MDKALLLRQKKKMDSGIFDKGEAIMQKKDKNLIDSVYANMAKLKKLVRKRKALAAKYPYYRESK